MTGEALAARLRPGNAGANTVADHLGVLDDAVAQLPAEVAVGHRPGENAALVARPVVVRTDSAATRMPSCLSTTWSPVPPV
jgi:hypothetical protein